MKTFILLLTVWTSETPVPDVYVLDSNLSGQDCINAMIDFAPMEENGLGILSCEFDHGEPN